MSSSPERRVVAVNSDATPSEASEVRSTQDSSPGKLSTEFEGDYRPAEISSDAENQGRQTRRPPRIHIPYQSEGGALPQMDFLLRLADALNNTLDLQTLMLRVAELVKAVVDYRIFAIFLWNERSHDLWMRFQVGHSAEFERVRIKVGRGLVGQAAETREAVLVEDVSTAENYISANPDVRSELAVPLIFKNRLIGVIDIESVRPAAFNIEQQHLLELVASRMAIAIENARLYTRVSRQAQTLTVLNEISRELTSILDLDDLLERVGTLLKRIIDFQMFTILLWSDRSQQFEHRFSTRYGQRVRREQGAQYGVGVIGQAAESREPVLAPDVRKDRRYIQTNAEVRSELAVPLIYKGKVIGVLDLEHIKVNYYNEEHQRTLVTLAGQIAIAITNARLYERIYEEEQRLERDLNMAREVQLRLLPPPPEALPNAEFATRFLPARSIGGDVYDFISYGNNRVAIAVGDVSGKAAPAALYAALVSGVLRSLAARRLSPGAMLNALNSQLQERRLDSQYVTMIFAVWNDDNRTLQIANAGSVQPMLVTRSGGQVRSREIKAEGFPLGLFPNAEYEEFSISTQPGDQVVFFSDGIADAENRQGMMFGSERLCEILENAPAASAEQTVANVLHALDTFQDGTEHFDDETLVILQVR